MAGFADTCDAPYVMRGFRSTIEKTQTTGRYSNYRTEPYTTIHRPVPRLLRGTLVLVHLVQIDEAALDRTARCHRPSRCRGHAGRGSTRHPDYLGCPHRDGLQMLATRTRTHTHAHVHSKISYMNAHMPFVNDWVCVPARLAAFEEGAPTPPHMTERLIGLHGLLVHGWETRGNTGRGLRSQDRGQLQL